jgi:hypothetical protein
LFTTTDKRLKYRVENFVSPDSSMKQEFAIVCYIKEPTTDTYVFRSYGVGKYLFASEVVALAITYSLCEAYNDALYASIS